MVTKISLDGNIMTFQKPRFSSYELEVAACNNMHTLLDKVTCNLVSTDKTALFNFMKTCYPNFVNATENTAGRDGLYNDIKDSYSKIAVSFDIFAKQKIDYWDKLLDYQKEAIRLMVFRKHNVLSFEQGLGKTITTATVARLMSGESTDDITLVVCPSVVKWNWYRELIDKWKYPTDYISILDSQKSMINPNSKILILNYDLLKKYLPKILTFKKKIVHIVLDECHYVKNIRSIRYKAIRDICSQYNPKISLLSGTPIKNRVVDLFAYFQLIKHPLGNKYYKFVDTFTIFEEGLHGKKIVGATNIDYLRLLTANCIIRKTKEQCLTLPPKEFKQVYFELESYKPQYKAALKELKTKTNKQEMDLAIHTVNIITTKAKLKGIKQLADNIVYDRGKVVIFCSYKEPMADLKAYFGKRAVFIDGSTPSLERMKRIDAFRYDPSIEVLIGQTMAAGIGINLEFVSDAILCNFPMTQSEIDQAMDRLHRHGQKSTVNVWYTVCQKSVDERLFQLVTSKRIDASSVLDGKVDNIAYENVLASIFESEEVEE